MSIPWTLDKPHIRNSSAHHVLLLELRGPSSHFDPTTIKHLGSLLWNVMHHASREVDRDKDEFDAGVIMFYI